MTIEKAIKAVQGGTSPIVASHLYKVSVAEIEAALVPQESMIAPGYAEHKDHTAAIRQSRTQARRERERLVRRVRAAREDESVSRDTAVTSGMIRKKHRLTYSALNGRVQRGGRWKKAPITDDDKARLEGIPLSGTQHVYWVLPPWTTLELQSMGVSRQTALTIGLVMQRDNLTLEQARHQVTGLGWEVDYSTLEDFDRLRVATRRALYVYWKEEGK